MNGLWITALVFLFIIGTMFSLKPSGKQKALGLLRERGRMLGLQPKLVACPQWLINAKGEKGTGMVALYGLVISDAKLPLSESLVLDSVVNVVNGDIALADAPCSIDDALGITMQANFIGVYIKETLTDDMSLKMCDAQLNILKQQLQAWAAHVSKNI